MQANTREAGRAQNKLMDSPNLHPQSVKCEESRQRLVNFQFYFTEVSIHTVQAQTSSQTSGTQVAQSWSTGRVVGWGF